MTVFRKKEKKKKKIKTILTDVEKEEKIFTCA